MEAKTITAVIGDLHIGGSTALAPPQFEIHDSRGAETQLVQHNRLQSWLWDSWTDYWDYVRHLAGGTGKRRKHRLIIVNLGEFIDGIHHGTNQVMIEIEDQVSLAMAIMQPIVDGCDGFYGVVGTDAHAGASGNTDSAIYKALGATAYNHHLVLDIDGVVMDFAHHGRVGRRPWTSQAAAVATEVAIDCAEQGAPLPRYVFRAHNHVVDDSGEKFEDIRVVSTPSWQLKTAFGWGVSSQRTRSDIGGLVVDGDRLDFSRARYKGQPDGRRVIKV